MDRDDTLQIKVYQQNTIPSSNHFIILICRIKIHNYGLHKLNIDVLQRSFACVMVVSFACVMVVSFACVMVVSFACVMVVPFACVMVVSFACVMVVSFAWVMVVSFACVMVVSWFFYFELECGTNVVILTNSLKAKAGTFAPRKCVDGILSSEAKCRPYIKLFYHLKLNAAHISNYSII